MAQPQHRITSYNVCYTKLLRQIDNKFYIEVIPESGTATHALYQKQFSGKRISLNFQNIPVRSLLQLFAQFTNQNIVVSDSVTGSLTLRLMNVPWDQALVITSYSIHYTKLYEITQHYPAKRHSCAPSRLNSDLTYSFITHKLRALKTEFEP